VGSTLPPIFSPIVTATCRAGIMTVKVETLDNFVGVVQSRDYRKPECSSYGENTRVTFLRMNMLSQATDLDYCGVFVTDVRTLVHYRVYYGFRLKKRDNYFWVNFDNFESSSIFGGSWGSIKIGSIEPKTEPPPGNLAYPNP
jgi:hypothetical protein